MQLALHEGRVVEDLLTAVKRRTFHAFHTEGAGGGHAPDIRIAGEPYGSSHSCACSCADAGSDFSDLT